MPITLIISSINDIEKNKEGTHLHKLVISKYKANHNSSLYFLFFSHMNVIYKIMKEKKNLI